MAPVYDELRARVKPRNRICINQLNVSLPMITSLSLVVATEDGYPPPLDEHIETAVV